MSDGTPAGTARVATLAPSWLTAVGETLFFVAGDAAGVELWQSDGSAAGTVLVADLVPGSGGSAPADLTAACGRLYFTATTPATGRELWALDVEPGVCAGDGASCVADAQCSIGNLCTGDVCSAPTGCSSSFSFACCSDAACDDGDACTADACAPVSGCSHTLLPDLQAVTCTLGGSGSEAALCPGELIPARLARPLDRARSRVAAAAEQSVPARARRRIITALRTLARITRRIERATAREMISPTCGAALTILVATAHDRAASWVADESVP